LHHCLDGSSPWSCFAYNAKSKHPWLRPKFCVPTQSGCDGAISLASITPVTSGELSGCVIVSGMPGAGKSTVSGLAASLMPRAAQIKGDEVNQMILGGRVWFMGEPRDEALRQYELCKRNMCALRQQLRLGPLRSV
jgi:hypothetical protein